MRLAVLQANAKVMDPEANLRTLDAAAARAADAGAAVLVTPELFLTGYAPGRIRDGVDANRLAALRSAAAEIARRRRIAVVYSLPAVAEDGTWRITATLVDNGGDQLLDYAKVHLFGGDERKAFAPAEQPPAVVDLYGMKTSLLVCYDVEFPEAVRAAADRGAQLLLVPTALSAGFDSVPQVLLRARALESQVAIAYANHSGSEDGLELLGGSVIVGPEGQLLAEAGAGAELLVADITPQDVESARRKVPYLTERRTDLYGRWERERKPGS